MVTILRSLLVVVPTPASTTAVSGIGATAITAGTTCAVASGPARSIVVVTTVVAPAVSTSGTIIVPAIIVASIATCTTLVTRLRLGIVSTAALEATLGALGAVKCFVNANDPSVKFLVVHGAQSSIRLGVSSKADEAEAAAALSRTVLHDNGFLDLAKLLETLAQGVIASMPRKAVNEELRHGVKI